MTVARTFVKPGDCVWDVGSNQGIFAACAASQAGAQGHVFSVEADPTYAALQHRTFSRFPNTVAPCSVLSAAVSDKIGIVDFAVSTRGHARSSIASLADGPAASHKPVVTVTLDFLLDHWPVPNVLKIDVEGADLMVLRGSRRLLSVARPIIYIEISAENHLACSAILSDSGYSVGQLRLDGTVKPDAGYTPYALATPY